MSPALDHILMVSDPPPRTSKMFPIEDAVSARLIPEDVYSRYARFFQ